MIKNRLFLLVIALTAVLFANAQKDSRAKQLLDEVAATYEQTQGMKITFKGTQTGTLWLKGECFVLECNGVKSWFDGTTQWSYVEENEEVNISSPTPEELQSINPFSLVTMYRKGFYYQYEGMKTRANKKGQEVFLLPVKNGNIKGITLTVNSRHLPFYIGIDMENGHYEEFIADSIEPMSLPEDFFRFDRKRYPDAEVIDLR